MLRLAMEVKSLVTRETLYGCTQEEGKKTDDESWINMVQGGNFVVIQYLSSAVHHPSHSTLVSVYERKYECSRSA